MDKKEINFSDSHYLIDLEEGMWEVEIRYHYRITDEGHLQLISFDDDKLGKVYTELKKTEASLKENLSNLLEQYIEYNRFYMGFPIFIDSVLFTRDEYEALIEKIRAELDIQRKKAEQNRTPLIEYLERKELRPKPSGNNARSWIAKCPSEGSHFIMVTTDPDEWGCGYCNRKGGIKELETWFNELDQKKLTKFMKEINSGGIQTKETMKWWRNRY